jgi:chorismate mutase
VNESLHKRLAELSLEIRNYPTPIARCDEQLAHLLEERSALASKINILEEQGNCSPLALWINDGGFHAA